MIYRFGDYSLDTEKREVRHGTIWRRIEPQVFDILIYLLHHRDRVVSSDELLQVIWKGRIVSESVLSTRINAVRFAIGDNGREQRLIRTLRGRGFRFVGTVAQEEQPPAVVFPAALPDYPSVAVLPFASDPQRCDIAVGLTEDLITALSKADWFSVIARDLSLAHAGNGPIAPDDIARKLGARYAACGSVRATLNSVRISIQLVCLATGQRIWCEQYDRNIESMATLSIDIAEPAAGEIARRLYLVEEARALRLPAESTTAWNCIVRALSLMNTRERPLVAQARGLLEQAIALDPKSAQAHSLLSYVTSLEVHQGWVRRNGAVPRAMHFAQAALSRNPEDGWSHLAAGYAMIWQQPEEAVPMLEKALTLNPKLAVGHYLVALASTYAGQHDHVFEHADKAAQLSQLDLLAYGNAGAPDNVRATASWATERYEDGIRFAQRTLIQNPKAPTAYRAFLLNCAMAGEVERAQRALATLKRLAPNMSQRWLNEIGMWVRAADQKKYREAFRVAGLK
jgi:TolB-like protein